MRYFFISFFVLTLGFVSCEQEAALDSASSPEVLELGSYEQLESLLFDIAMEMDGGQTITILSDSERGYYSQIGAKANESGSLQARKVRCSGNGVSFVKCEKNAVDRYGCQKISSGPDGNYTSEDC